MSLIPQVYSGEKCMGRKSFFWKVFESRDERQPPPHPTDSFIFWVGLYVYVLIAAILLNILCLRALTHSQLKRVLNHRLLKQQITLRDMYRLRSLLERLIFLMGHIERRVLVNLQEPRAVLFVQKNINTQDTKMLWGFISCLLLP